MALTASRACSCSCSSGRVRPEDWRSALLLAAPVLTACQPTSSDENLLGYLILGGALAGTALAVAATTLLVGAAALLVGSTALTAYWARPGPVTRAVCAVAGVVDLGSAVVMVAGLGCLFDLRPETCGTFAGVLPVVGLGFWNLLVAARAPKGPGEVQVTGPGT